MAILDNPGAWPPDFSTCVFLARVLTDLPPDIVWAALKSGELAVRTYSKGATKFTPILKEPQNLRRCHLKRFVMPIKHRCSRRAGLKGRSRIGCMSPAEA